MKRCVKLGTASARKIRKNATITRSSSNFSDSIKRNDYTSAGKIVYWTSLKISGKNGIINALEKGNSFYKRKSNRRGL